MRRVSFMIVIMKRYQTNGKDKACCQDNRGYFKRVTKQSFYHGRMLPSLSTACQSSSGYLFGIQLLSKARTAGRILLLASLGQPLF